MLMSIGSAIYWQIRSQVWGHDLSVTGQSTLFPGKNAPTHREEMLTQ